MNISSMVICDRDRDYGGRLADHLRRSECGYDVMLYTDPLRFMTEWQHKNISLLLMEEDFLLEGHLSGGFLMMNIFGGKILAANLKI